VKRTKRAASEAYERFELPEEIYQQGRLFLDIYERMQKLFDFDKD
jgi:hypothetical protein